MAISTPIKIALLYETVSQNLANGCTPQESPGLDQDEKIETIIHGLENIGYNVHPVGDLDALTKQIARGEHENWEIGFLIPEGTQSTVWGAQVREVLGAHKIPCAFSDAEKLSLSLDRTRIKTALEGYGILTAPFAVVSPPSLDNGDSESPTVAGILEKGRHALDLEEFPLFVKPARSGSTKDFDFMGKVHTMDDLVAGVQTLQGQFPEQDILIEKFLSGREYSVSILGTGGSARVVGTCLLDWDVAGSPASTGSDDVASPSLSTSSRASYILEVREYPTAPDNPEVRASEELALRAWRAMEYRDAGCVVVRWDSNRKPYVLTVKPLPEISPGYSVLAETARHRGMNYETLLGGILSSAFERYPHLEHRRLKMCRYGWPE